ncbi:MAG: AMP-binding protein [Clostridiales bacterium]|nr:AMP-binding protein [Clostridiales bacterium]
MNFYEINPQYRDRLMLAEESGRRVTYGDFATFYQGAKERLEKGRLLFLFCENSIGAVFVYLTCLNRGIVPALLDKNLDPALARALIHTYRPEYLAMPEPMEPESLLSGTDTPFTQEDLSSGCFGYRLYRSDETAPEALHPDLALLLTTSGSTGSPKLVRQSRKNIAANAASIASYLELDAGERPITSLPMPYTYGLSVINSHLLVGAAILLTRRTLFDREFWSFFRAEGATSISGVPYTYEMMRRLSFFDMDLPTLRTMTQAGGKLSPKLHREFAEFAERSHRRFIVMYGQTEATARMGYLPPGDALRKCGSMGIAIPGGRFRLMEDEQTEITEADVVGELVYEGDNVTMGYATTRADLSKGDERGGVLFTGDMARRDADGYYYITGRKKRFLKMFGKRVNMDEIEQMVKQQYDGMDVACTGEDDHMRIYLTGADETVCGQVLTWITEKTGLHPTGVRVLPIDAIPKNSSGKTIYMDLPKE